ncbi:MAG: MBL fold metallo-hydrolase [Oscillospiraceae bacterium]
MSTEMKAAPARERSRLPVQQRCPQNAPIRTLMRDRRVYELEPIDATCWAYMKLLREGSESGRVYDVDPFAEVYKFRDNVYGILTESADGMGDPWSYLVMGPEKAMLIDTGFGIGDLKGLVDEITGGMPIIVVNTHCHFDHAYGNSQFDKVYVHEYEAPVVETLDEHIWDYLFDDNGQGIWFDFERGDIVPFKKYEVVHCPDGYTFDLGGGHEVELIHMGGHTAGHAGFLDKKDRIFFAGDDLISMRVGINGPKPGTFHGECASVTELSKNYERLACRLGEFDHVFTGHFVTDIESSAVLSMCKALKLILEDPTGNATMIKDTPRGKQYHRYVEGLGTIAYKLESV